MYRRIVLSLTIALFMSSAVLAGGLDQCQINCVGSCPGGPCNPGPGCGGHAPCGWAYQNSVTLVQHVGSIGHCGGTGISQSIHISNSIGCGPQPGCGGCGQGGGITSQSSMFLAAHSGQPCGGTSIMMMASRSLSIH